MQETEENMFSDRGVTFDDILLNGQLGGKRAVIAYLDMRYNQIKRQLETDENSENDRSRMVLAVHALREARVIMSSVGSV
jgi:hypothetical protein